MAAAVEANRSAPVPGEKVSRKPVSLEEAMEHPPLQVVPREPAHPTIPNFLQDLSPGLPEAVPTEISDRGKEFLSQHARRLLQESPRLDQASVYDTLKENFADEWSMYVEQYGDPRMDAVGENPLKLVVRSEMLKQGPPPFPISEPLDLDAVSAGLAEDFADSAAPTVVVDSVPTVSATDSEMEPGSEEDTAVAAPAVPPDLQVYPQAKKENSFLSRIRNLQERMSSHKRQNEYLGFLEPLRLGTGAVAVVFLDSRRSGKPESPTIIAEGDSLFCKNWGLTYEELAKRQDFSLADPKNKQSPYLLNGPSILLQMVDRSIVEQRMQEPTAFLLENTGAELIFREESSLIPLLRLDPETWSTDGTLSPEIQREIANWQAKRGIYKPMTIGEILRLERSRLGAREVQKNAIDLEEQIDEILDDIFGAVQEVESLPGQAELPEDASAALRLGLEKMQKIREELVNKNRKDVISQVKKLLETVSGFATVVNRYRSWDIDTFPKESALGAALIQLNDGVDFLEQWLEAAESLDRKSLKGSAREAAMSTTQNLFTAETFENKVVGPMLDFWSALRQEIIAVYQQEYDFFALDDRVDAYVDGLELPNLDVQSLLDVFRPVYPQIDDELSAYLQSEEMAQVSDVQEAAEAVERYLYRKLFGQYEEVLQSGFHRILSAVEVPSEEAAGQLLDAYTNIVEVEASVNFARRAVADAVTPVVHRAIFIALQRPETNEFQILQQLGVVPAGSQESFTTEEIFDQVVGWLETNPFAEKSQIEALVVYVSQNMSQFAAEFDHWAGNREPMLFSGLAEQSQEAEMWPEDAEIIEEEDWNLTARLQAMLLGSVTQSKVDYITRARALVAPDGEIDVYQRALLASEESMAKLQDMLGDEDNQLAEDDDIRRDISQLSQFLYALADVRDGQADGEVSAEYMWQVAHRMNALIDEHYTPVAVRIQEHLQS